MVKPDIAFKIHFFLFDKFHTDTSPRFSLGDISEGCLINDLKLTKKHCDFLEYEKYLIRNWNSTGGDRTSYQQESSGDAVMEIIKPTIIQELQRIDHNEINRILKTAPSDWIKFYKYIHEYGVDRDDLPILETIIAEYWKYVEKLKVFEIQLIPDKLNVRTSDGVITVHGTISKPYHKKSGKIPIKIFRNNSNEVVKEENCKFVKEGTITGAISFQMGYKSGEYDLVGYYQLRGRATGRYEEPNSGRIPFTISNT